MTERAQGSKRSERRKNNPRIFYQFTAAPLIREKDGVGEGREEERSSMLVPALCADYSAGGKAISGQSFGAAKDGASGIHHFCTIQIATNSLMTDMMNLQKDSVHGDFCLDC
jgi:hypothetical protein